MTALSALVRKDLVLYFSNRRAVLITLAAPILIAAFFGSVLGGPPKKPSRVPVAVVDLDNSAVSQSIARSITEDPSFEAKLQPEAAAITQVREGKARAAVFIPKGFGEGSTAAMFNPALPRPDLVIHFDPSQAVTVAMIKGLVTQHVIAAIGKAMSAGRGGAGFSTPFGISEVEVASGGASKYSAYAHSFAGMGVQFVLFMGIELGVGLLLMRRSGMWKRLRAAPVSRRLLLGSRIISGTAIALLLLIGIYAAAILVFGVRVEGSIIGFAAVLLAFALLASTFGLLIAAVGKTPEATRGIAILATLLLVMLGGAWVPTFVFPEWLQTATQVVPTRWAIDGLDAMTWRGLGLEAVAQPVVAMLACSALFAWIAIKRFDWEE
ncbi:MAG: ABC transporter permease [Usitatibacter sp.]